MSKPLITPTSKSDERALTPAEVLSRYAQALSPFEQREIKEYTRIYFFAPNAHKVRYDTAKLNCGFDWQGGRYRLILNDHLQYRYEVVGELGNGVFGDVVRAFDHKTMREVAVKVTHNETSMRKMALAEAGFLDRIKTEDKADLCCAARMLDAFFFREHVCMVFDILGDSLKTTLKAQSRGFPEQEVRLLATDILRCLSLLNRMNMVHSDLKPDNLLFTDSTRSHLRVIDFGCACKAEGMLYGEAQSLFYRSPEVIIDSGFGMAADMWSFGCIVAELFTGRILLKGKTQADQLLLQMELLGFLPKSMIAHGHQAGEFFDGTLSPRSLLDRKGVEHIPNSRRLDVELKGASDCLVDFVQQCLMLNPRERITPIDALSHAFITGSFFIPNKSACSVDSSLILSPTPSTHTEQTAWV